MRVSQDLLVPIITPLPNFGDGQDGETAGVGLLIMKAKTGFRLTDVCGNYILVAEGKENLDYSYIISMNESSKLLWDSIQDKDLNDEDLAQILMDNYEINKDTPLPHDLALSDVRNIVEKWNEVGIITK